MYQYKYLPLLMVEKMDCIVGLTNYAADFANKMYVDKSSLELYQWPEKSSPILRSTDRSKTSQNEAL